MLLKAYAGPVKPEEAPNSGVLYKILENPENYDSPVIHKDEDKTWYALPVDGIFKVDARYASEHHPLSLKKRVYVADTPAPQNGPKPRQLHVNLHWWEGNTKVSMDYNVDFFFKKTSDYADTVKQKDVHAELRAAGKNILAVLIREGMVEFDLDEMYKTMQYGERA
jgi:hypothetical protein